MGSTMFYMVCYHFYYLLILNTHLAKSEVKWRQFGHLPTLSKNHVSSVMVSWKTAAATMGEKSDVLTQLLLCG